MAVTWAGKGGASTWDLTDIHHNGFLTNGSEERCVPNPLAPQGPLEEAAELSRAACIKGKTRAKEAIRPVSLNTLGWCGFPNPTHRAKAPLKLSQVVTPWPGQPISLRAWDWMDCLLPKRAKNSARSAISLWEGRFYQSTPPPPLLLILSVPQRERGQKTGSAEPLDQIKALSTLWFSLHNSLTCRVSHQSVSESRSTAGSGDGLPQGSSDQGTQRRPCSHFQNDTLS